MSNNQATEPLPHALSGLEIRFHSAMPNWCKIVGLKIRAIPKCEGGGFAIDRLQGEKIMDMRSHVMRLEMLIMEKNRIIAAARGALSGGSAENAC